MQYPSRRRPLTRAIQLWYPRRGHLRPHTTPRRTRAAPRHRHRHCDTAARSAAMHAAPPLCPLYRPRLLAAEASMGHRYRLFPLSRSPDVIPGSSPPGRTPRLPRPPHSAPTAPGAAPPDPPAGRLRYACPCARPGCRHGAVLPIVATPASTSVDGNPRDQPQSPLGALTTEVNLGYTLSGDMCSVPLCLGVRCPARGQVRC